jgi:hypothetical protein
MIPKGPLACLVLSIFLPGLGHLVQRRFRRVGWYCLVWLLLIAGGLFLYGGAVGFCMLGLAIGLHTWIAGHQLMRALTGGRWKLLVAGIALFVLLLIYGTAPRAILPDLAIGRTTLTIPYQNVQPGDYLLARRSRARREFIRPGSLVLARLVRTRDRMRHVAGAMIVQVLALPGDTLELKEGRFILNGRELDAERYPVPRWLRRGEFSVKMGHDRYFVSSEYETYTRGRAPTQGVTAEYIFGVCIIRHTDIEAQAFMLWLPLSRRRFIRAVE